MSPVIRAEGSVLTGFGHLAHTLISKVWLHHGTSRIISKTTIAHRVDGPQTYNITGTTLVVTVSPSDNDE